MSKTLVKLVDSAIFPAALLIVSKVLGLVLTNNIFGLNWGIDHQIEQFQLFSVQILYTDHASIITATTYSNLIMYGVIFIGLVVRIIQARFLHNEHISPRLLTKLAENNLLTIVKTSFDIYLEGSIWLAFSWLAWFIVFINFVLELNSLGFCLSILLVQILATTIFFRQINREFEESKKNLKL
ncbi:MAG: hypothetical protein WCK31_01385 [bacterium]